MTIENLKNKVSFLCRKEGIKRNDLAKRMNVAPSVLSRMLNGNPSFDSINKIAEALQVPLAELFSDRPYDEVEGYITIKGKTYQFKSYNDLASALEIGEKTICSYTLP